MSRYRLALLLLAMFAAPAAATEPKEPAAAKLTAEDVAFFEKKIRPVLATHCYSCHSAKAKNLRGGLFVDSRQGLLKGGDSGPAIVPGEPDKSLLIQAVRRTEETSPMPPEERLPAEAIADLEAWVRRGAPDPRDGGPPVARINLEQAREFWSFRPVVQPPVPQTDDPAASPIDAFLMARLGERGLRASRPADRRTLLRRATYDLTGLPPTPEEMQAFLQDDSAEAFAKVIDRLLASPAYGERWGRHWMDVIRYADTAGDNSDYPIPQMHLYRNWIIGAFNRDLPYDEFLRQQIAGDLLPAANEADRREKLIATGYLANTKRFGSYEDARYPWYLTYEDQIDNLGRAFLALTINCTRCHDHKFDPISQQDYYALYGFFSSTRYPRPGIELDKVQRDFVPLATAEEVAAFEAERANRQRELDERIKRLDGEKKAAEEQREEAKKTADSAEKEAKVAELNARIDSLKKQLSEAQKQRSDLSHAPPPFATAYAVAEGQTAGNRKVGNVAVHIKGDPERLGPEVPRRFPEALGGERLPATEPGSGRLYLANWLADPQNPLTARVMANRIWQHHFGRGIVATPNDFGAMGRAPTHPELLDWLAAALVEKQWSIKALHRLIMLSQAYQQASDDNEEFRGLDPTNELLWRFNRRRLEAESIRDTLLAVAGNLDATPGGAHPFPEQKSWNFTQHHPFKAVYDANKRSVYLMTQRIQRHPFLALFDGPDTNASTAARVVSTTPLQSLYLMNDPFVHQQARALAQRLLRERPDDAARIERAFELLYGRPPLADELEAAQEHLEKAAGENLAAREDRAWPSLVRALLLSNELVYVE